MPEETKPDASQLLDMTVEQLIKAMMADGNHDPRQGRGHSFVAEDEYGRTALTILIGSGPYAQDLIDYHEVSAPGVRFVLSSKEQKA